MLSNEKFVLLTHKQIHKFFIKQFLELHLGQSELNKKHWLIFNCRVSVSYLYIFKPCVALYTCSSERQFDHMKQFSRNFSMYEFIVIKRWYMVVNKSVSTNQIYITISMETVEKYYKQRKRRALRSEEGKIFQKLILLFRKLFQLVRLSHLLIAPSKKQSYFQFEIHNSCTYIISTKFHFIKKRLHILFEIGIQI